MKRLKKGATRRSVGTVTLFTRCRGRIWGWGQVDQQGASGACGSEFLLLGGASKEKNGARSGEPQDAVASGECVGTDSLRGKRLPCGLLPERGWTGAERGAPGSPSRLQSQRRRFAIQGWGEGGSSKVAPLGSRTLGDGREPRQPEAQLKTTYFPKFVK